MCANDGGSTTFGRAATTKKIPRAACVLTVSHGLVRSSARRDRLTVAGPGAGRVEPLTAGSPWPRVRGGAASRASRRGRRGRWRSRRRRASRRGGASPRTRRPSNRRGGAAARRAAKVRALRGVHRDIRALRLPGLVGAPVHGPPVPSRVFLLGQAPGPHEARLGRPFAWTAGRTLFSWFERACGATEREPGRGRAGGRARPRRAGGRG